METFAVLFLVLEWTNKDYLDLFIRFPVIVYECIYEQNIFRFKVKRNVTFYIAPRRATLPSWHGFYQSGMTCTALNL